MKRNTKVDKWKDSWFIRLEPLDKLVFLYIVDNCDEAGFYELDSKLMSHVVGITPKQIVDCVVNIKKCYVPMVNSEGKKIPKIWIKNFLFHQDCLPLNADIKEHQNIKIILEKNIQFLKDKTDAQLIIDSSILIDENKSQNKRKRRTKTFKKPTFEEYEQFYKTVLGGSDCPVSEHYDYWESCGWMVGKKEMKDWKAAARNMIKKNNFRSVNQKINMVKTKIPEMKRASEAFLRNND